jgi:hypothetical protein
MHKEKAREDAKYGCVFAWRLLLFRDNFDIITWLVCKKGAAHDGRN